MMLFHTTIRTVNIMSDSVRESYKANKKKLSGWGFPTAPKKIFFFGFFDDFYTFFYFLEECFFLNFEIFHVIFAC